MESTGILLSSGFHYHKMGYDTQHAELLRWIFFFRKFYKCSKCILVSIMLYIYILVFLELDILWDMCIL